MNFPLPCPPPLLVLAAAAYATHQPLLLPTSKQGKIKIKRREEERGRREVEEKGEKGGGGEGEKGGGGERGNTIER